MNVPSLRFDRLRFDRVRIAAWLVPATCFTFSAFLLGGRHTAFAAAVQQGKRVDMDLFQARVDADAVAREIQDPRFACAPRQPKEEAAFFAKLRSDAALNQVTIVRWRSQASTFGENQVQSGPSSEKDAVRGKALKGVTKVSCELTLDGTYPALRNFLRALWKSDRLYTLSNVLWSRVESGNELTMTLDRYVAPAPPKPSSAPTSSVEDASKS